MDQFGWTFRPKLLLALLASILALAAVSPGVNAEPRWKARSVTLSVSTSLEGAPNIRGDVNAALKEAVAAWSSVADVRMAVTASIGENVSPAGARGDGVNLITAAATAENLKLFPRNELSPPATTRVFRSRAGFVTEADLVLNPFVQFSDDGSPGTFDLRSVITHEIGHVLGLEHSPVLSSVMYAQTASHRAGSGVSRGGEMLTAVDIAAIRALYGPPSGDLQCCAAITGKIGRSAFPPKTDIVVWAEDAATGRIVAAGLLPADGRFVLDGLSSGQFRLFAQAVADSSAALELGVFKADTDDLVAAGNFTLDRIEAPGIEYIGLNGQIANLPTAVSRGQRVRMVAGGKRFDPSQDSFLFSTPLLAIDRNASFTLEYPGSILASAVQVNIAEEAPAGEYDLFTRDAAGNRRFLLGAVIVR